MNEFSKYLEVTDEEYKYSNNKMKFEYGIFDTIKHNNLFYSLLSIFELDSLSNLQIYFLIIQNLEVTIPIKNKIPPIYQWYEFDLRNIKK